MDPEINTQYTSPIGSSDKKKSAVIIIITLIVLALGYYVFFIRLGVPQFDIRKFSGNVVVVEGNMITLHGMFSGSSTIPENLKSERDFSFQAGEATQFKKADIRWPTWEELAKQGTSGTFNIEDLPRTDVESSLDDFTKSALLKDGRAVYAEVDFLTSIYNSKNPTASYVFYQLVGTPTPSSSQNP